MIKHNSDGRRIDKATYFTEDADDIVWKPF